MFHAHRYIRSVFTYVNTSFVCIANSPLLSERENELTESQNLPRNGEVIGGENLRPAMVNI